MKEVQRLMKELLQHIRKSKIRVELHAIFKKDHEQLGFDWIGKFNSTKRTKSK